jgi:hypothetical protein
MTPVKRSPLAVLGLLVLKSLIPVITLVYIYRLEKPDCNCIRDWRHDFIKYFSIIFIIISVILALFNYNNTIITVLIGLLVCVLAYSLFTYVGDLNTKNCKCAIESSPWIHEFLYFWRYIYVLIAVFIIIAVVINLLTTFYIINQSNSKNKIKSNEKKK